MARLDQHLYDRLGQLQEQLRDNPLAAERIRKEVAVLIPGPAPRRTRVFRNHSNRISVHRAQKGGRQ